MIMNQNLKFLETMAGALATGRSARVGAATFESPRVGDRNTWMR
jgi:hypothetical protein